MKSYDELKAEMEAIQQQMVEAKKNERTNALKEVKRLSENLNVSQILFKLLTEENSVVLYGATEEASYIADKFPDSIIGIVDKKYSIGEEWNNIPCLHISNIRDNTLVINCVTAAHHSNVYRMLNDKTKMVINFYDLICWLLPNEQFAVTNSIVMKNWCDFPITFEKYISAFKNYRSSFEDETSIKHYDDFLNGKIVGNIAILATDKSFQDPSTMYFQDFLPNLAGYTFIDVGSYDGSNSEAFLEKYTNTNAVGIEPNPENAELIKRKMKKFSKRFSLDECALSDKHEKATISLEGSSSTVSPVIKENELSSVIHTTTLDDLLQKRDLLNEKIFVKMDVEGAEHMVLLGAKNTIKNKNAIFAISCYHKSTDLVDFYNIFKDELNQRKIYFRHLTSGACETVLFLV